MSRLKKMEKERMQDAAGETLDKEEKKKKKCASRICLLGLAAQSALCMQTRVVQFCDATLAVALCEPTGVHGKVTGKCASCLELTTLLAKGRATHWGSGTRGRRRRRATGRMARAAATTMMRRTATPTAPMTTTTSCG